MRWVAGVCCGKISVEEVAGLKGNHGVIVISTALDSAMNTSIAGRYCSRLLMSGDALRW